MDLNATETAQVRDLIAKQAEILSLATAEPTIISKLGATKKNLSQLSSAVALGDTDLLFVRQGTTDKSITGAVVKTGLTIPDATDTVKGIVELATDAEAQAFTANKFIDGEKLNTAFKGSNQLLSASGYQKLPGGLIIQWGTFGEVAANSSVLVTYSISFPTTTLFITTIGGATSVLNAGLNSEIISVSQSRFWNSSSSVALLAGNYLVIGY